MARNVNIGVRADTGRAEKPLRAVRGEISAIEESSNQSRSELFRLTRGFRRFDGQVKGTNLALLNFSRIIQDAPFGLLGIANNIDPALQSLQQLSANARQAGTTVSSALLGAITGPTGIALGVSAVTSLAIAFGDDLYNAIVRSTQSLEEFREKAREVLDDVLRFDLSVSGVEVTQQNIDEVLGVIRSRAEEALSQPVLFQAVRAAERGDPDFRERVLAGEEEAIARLRRELDTLLSYRNANQAQVEAGARALEEELIALEALTKQQERFRRAAERSLEIRDAIGEQAPGVERIGLERADRALGRDAAAALRRPGALPDQPDWLPDEDAFEKAIEQLSGFGRAVEAGVLTPTQAARRRISVLEGALLEMAAAGETNTQGFAILNGMLQQARAEIDATTASLSTMDQVSLQTFASIGSEGAAALLDLEGFLLDNKTAADALQQSVRGLLRSLDRLFQRLLDAGLQAGLLSLFGVGGGFGSLFTTILGGGNPFAAGARAAVAPAVAGSNVLTGELRAEGSELVAAVTIAESRQARRQ